MTTTKIALAALLVAGTASAAMAQGFDPNPANRYPAHAAPGATLRSAPVQLNTGRAIQVAPRAIQNNWVPAPAHAGGVG
jgi:hypothetical protein